MTHLVPEKTIMNSENAMKRRKWFAEQLKVILKTAKTSSFSSMNAPLPCDETISGIGSKGKTRNDAGSSRWGHV